MKKRHETNEKERNKRKIPIFRLFRSFSFVSCSLFFVTFSILILAAQSDARQKREQLYRLNNLGVALMEQFKHEEAAKQFKQALAADPDFALARINLALALYFLNDSRAAAEEAKAAVKLAPESPNAHYVLGIALRNEKLYDEAIAEFNKVLAIDRKDPATNINIGQIYSQKQQHSQAIPFFRNALEAEPFNATAAYSLGQALIRTGKTADGQNMLARFQQLRASGYATTLGNVYGEKGRYAEAVLSSGAEPDLVSSETTAGFVQVPAGLAVKTNVKSLTSFTATKISKSQFNDAKKRDLIAAFSSNLAIGDFDNDHRPDLFFSGIDNHGNPFVKLLRNDGGKFSDVTDKSKISAGQPVSGAVFADFDNDGKNDLAVFGYQTLSLWRNNGDGSFTDATAKAGALVNYPSWAMTAAWVDLDHDGDLDLFTGNFADLRKWPSENETAVFPDDFPGEENKLFRNNGDGTFTDITERSGLGGGRNKTTAVVCTDFNNQRDIDFLVINYGAPVQLFSNQRDGSFKEMAEQAGIKYSGRSFGVAAGDYNKDGFTDFAITGLNINGESAVFTSDGRGGFKLSRLATGKNSEQQSNTLGAQFLDYDNDGLLDIALQSGQVLAIRRNLGDRFVNSEGLADLNLAEGRTFVSGDLFSTGRMDIAAIKDDGTLVILKNRSEGNNYLAVNLNGKTSNRSAIGAKVELRSGSLRQKLEIYASSPAPAPAGVTFGLGYRNSVDALQLLWPAGILQSELAVKASSANSFDELDRKGTSCPLLYAWNGDSYRFVTDFLGGSAIGYLVAPGQYNYPDTDEYIRVSGDQLKEHEGLLSLRMNNQLEEVIYFDALKLLAVDHPADREIYPNERLMPGPPYPEFKIYSVKSPRPPLQATDDKDRDILPLIREIDRRYPDDFVKLPFKGYANEHAITLDLGDIKKGERALLLMTAWIDYADSTSNLAAAQAGQKLTPPYLQVINAKGEWETVIPRMGFPAGLPKTMTVDLTGKFLCNDSRVRIVTSMRIYWDQILVDTSAGKSPFRVSRIDPVRAELRWRGFPREYSPDGRLPLIYDYQTIEPQAPWKAHIGNYTRFGDVRELLVSPDDMYVITRSGDEVQVDFDARKLPALPAGWKRTFLLYADGFGKDMDINSARPDTIGELPYHAMKSYPYSPADSYPRTKRHQEYIEGYNTRNINAQLQASWRGVR